MLQQSINYRGVVLPSALIKASRATFTNAETPSVNVVVSVYADQAAYDSEKPPLFQQEVSFSMTEDNHKALFNLVLGELNKTLQNFFPGSTLVEEPEEEASTEVNTNVNVNTP